VFTCSSCSSSFSFSKYLLTVFPFLAEEREKVLAQARVGYVPEAEVATRLKEANERATAANKAAKCAQSEVEELTEVLNDKSKELEDVVEAHKEALAAVTKAKDDALAAAIGSHEKQLVAVRKAHEAELAAEREASSSTILALQREKITFEAFVHELSRQLLGEYRYLLFWSPLANGWSTRESPSMASP
jgi:hypothetical protein